MDARVPHVGLGWIVVSQSLGLVGSWNYQGRWSPCCLLMLVVLLKFLLELSLRVCPQAPIVRGLPPIQRPAKLGDEVVSRWMRDLRQ